VICHLTCDLVSYHLYGFNLSITRVTSGQLLIGLVGVHLCIDHISARGLHPDNNEEFSSYYFQFHCYCQLNELQRRVPINSVLCSFYNTGMYVLSFCSYFRIVFMFFILGDEVSYGSPFCKPFWNSSDAHSGFSIASILEPTLGSSYLCGIVCELVHGMVELIMDFGLKVFQFNRFCDCEHELQD